MIKISEPMIFWGYDKCHNCKGKPQYEVYLCADHPHYVKFNLCRDCLEELENVIHGYLGAIERKTTSHNAAG